MEDPPAPFEGAARNAQEQAALDARYETVYAAANGARVFRPEGWGPEGGKEMEIAERIADSTGEDVYLAPRVEVEGLKLLDAWQGGEGWEFERVNPDASNLQNAVKQRLREGKEQASRIAVFLDNDQVEPPLEASVGKVRESINRGIANAIFYDSKELIQVIAVLTRSGDYQLLTRQAFEDDGIRFEVFREGDS